MKKASLWKIFHMWIAQIQDSVYAKQLTLKMPFKTEAHDILKYSIYFFYSSETIRLVIDAA